MLYFVLFHFVFYHYLKKKQNFNGLYKKYIQKQRNLYNNFFLFKFSYHLLHGWRKQIQQQKQQQI